MRMPIAAIAAAALLIAASPPVGTADAPSTIKPATNPDQKKICHEVGEIGTPLGTKRVCRTAAEEQQARQNKRDFVDTLQRGFSRCNLPDPGKC